MAYERPDKRAFLALARAMDPNETVTGYLQAVERDLKRLTLIERRLNRIEKMLVLLTKSLGGFYGDVSDRIDELDKAVAQLSAAQQEAEENPYVPIAN